MKKKNLPRAGTEIGCTRVYTQHSSPLISFLSIKPAQLNCSDVNGTNGDYIAKENAALIKSFVVTRTLAKSESFSCKNRRDEYSIAPILRLFYIHSK